MLFLEPAESPLDMHFRVGNIPVRVSVWFWLISALFAWPYMQLGLAYLLIAILCVFVSILWHELGHVFMGRAFGAQGRIVLHGFGGLAIGSSDVPARWQRIAVSFAGPAAQLIIWAVIIAVEPDWRHLAQSMGARNRAYLQAMFVAVKELEWINLVWPLLNLLPVWPLDGGKISREVLTGLMPRDGLRWSLGLSVLVAGLLAAAGIYELATKQQLIPYVHGDMWTIYLFGSLAAASYQLLQQANANRPDRYRPRDDDYDRGDRAPWEQDPDYWKR